MAFSAVFSSSCTAQAQSSLFSSPNSFSLSRTTSLLPPQATQKFLYQPLRCKRISPIVVNPGRSFGKVKASLEMDEMSYNNVHVFSKDELAMTLARDIYDLSNKFIKERGFFTVVLCGGSLIKYLRKLVEPPLVDAIEWSKWHFFWVEERVLPRDHLDTNFRLAYDRLLSKVPNIDWNKNVHSINGYDLPAEEAATRFENELKRLVGKDNVIASSNGFPKFDLMLLNMGSHGHPDYLFPGDPKEDHKWITFTKNFRNPPKQRIAFTLPVINSSSNIAMVVTGVGKAFAVLHVLAPHPSKPKKHDVELISPQGEMKWYLDHGAASELMEY